MDAIRLERQHHADLDLDAIPHEVTERDQQIYDRITSISLTSEQRARVLEPPEVLPRQRDVIAVHWHPEFVPMELILERINVMFPGRRRELIIPTQHNVLMTLNGYAGVEIDCYSPEFSRKVQLLAHFSEEKVRKAEVLKAMLAHTFRYRQTQLFEFIDSLLEPGLADRIERAAGRTGASEQLVQFVQVHVRKIKQLVERNESTTPPEMLKNKLLRNYFNALVDQYDGQFISHCQIFLHAVKKIVKARFSLRHFYRTQEVIEEVRSLGGGIVIPHPEQFWPILLADYDIDGIEVWNPQSQQYTEFLVNVVNRQNRGRKRGQRPLLIFMGDDTHFGEKVIDPAVQDEEKAGRELGVQPAWDDLAIRKSLIVANADRGRLIENYRSRLD